MESSLNKEPISCELEDCTSSNCKGTAPIMQSTGSVHDIQKFAPIMKVEDSEPQAQDLLPLGKPNDVEGENHNQTVETEHNLESEACRTSNFNGAVIATEDIKQEVLESNEDTIFELSSEMEIGKYEFLPVKTEPAEGETENLSEGQSNPANRKRGSKKPRKKKFRGWGYSKRRYRYNMLLQKERQSNFNGEVLVKKKKIKKDVSFNMPSENKPGNVCRHAEVRENPPVPIEAVYLKMEPPDEEGSPDEEDSLLAVSKNLQFWASQQKVRILLNWSTNYGRLRHISLSSQHLQASKETGESDDELKKCLEKKWKGVNSDDEDWDPKVKKKEPKKRIRRQESGKKGLGPGRKEYRLSPELAALVGQETMTPSRVVGKVWEIIKRKDLADPADKRFTICNDELFKVFGVKRFRSFGMLKYLKAHFITNDQ